MCVNMVGLEWNLFFFHTCTDYAFTLIYGLLEKYERDPASIQLATAHIAIPQFLSDEFEEVDRKEVIKGYRARTLKE